MVRILVPYPSCFISNTCIVARIKDRKVGEGTYAVVYQGLPLRLSLFVWGHSTSLLPAGREALVGRKVAIKKIKVGQFKDGLDMSAIREVRYLRELKHQNIIEVSPLYDKSFSTCSFPPAYGCLFNENKPQPRARVS